MKTENANVQTGHGKSRKLRLIMWILAGLVGVILLVFFGTPLYLSSSGGTNFLLGKVNRSVDGQVQMDDFSIGWFKGIKLINLSYADNAGQTSVKVRRIETQPQYVSLLGGKVKLGKTVIDSPQVYLKVPQEKEKSPVADSPKTKPPAEPAGFPIDQIDFELIDGSATIELAGDVPQKVRFANIASKVQIAQAGKPSSLDISMDVNEESKISAKGTATAAKKGWTLEDGDFEVKISKLQLAGLKPLFALAGQDMDMAGELNADATIKIAQNQIQQLKADAVITGFAQGTGQQRTVFDQPIKLSALVTGEGKTIKIENAMVQSAFCTVNCSGSMDKLNYAVQSDLAQTLRFAGQFADMQGLGMEGDLSLEGDIALAEDRIALNGSGKIAKLIAQKGDLQTPVTDVQMDFDCAVDKAANQLQLASANLTAAPGTVRVSNLVLPMSPQAAKTISVDAQAKLDLAKTWAFAQVFAELPKDVQVAGMLDSAVKVDTQGSVIHILTDKAQIEGLKITRPDSTPFVQEKVSLDADIVLDTDAQTIDVRRLNLEAAEGQSLIKVSKGKFEKKVSQKTTKLNGDFEAQYDLKTISAFASAYLPQGLVMEGKRNDAFRFDSEYPTDKPELMKANLNASSTFGFDKASYFGLHFGKTDMTLNVQKGLVDFNIPETVVNEGKLRFSGTMNLAEEPLMFRLKEPMAILDKVYINDVMSQTLLMYANPIFTKSVKTSGIASFSCQQMEIPLSSKDIMQMTMRGTFGIDSLKMQAGDFLGQLLTLVKAGDSTTLTIHPTDFVVEKGYLSYKDMQVDIGNNPLNFKGQIGLNKTIKMDVQLPWTMGGSTVKTGEQASDRVTLPIEGDLTSPKINVAKLIEKQGQQLLEQEIRKGLEGIFK